MNQVVNIIKEFKEKIDQIYGIYLDSTFGFDLLKGYIARLPNRGNENEISWYYGKGKHGSENEKLLHACSIRDIKIRNEKNGSNYIMIGHFFVVLLYEYWEDKYRKEIAMKLNKDKNDICSDIIGEIRILRRGIVHNKGIVDCDIERKIKVIGRFKQGEMIFLDKKIIENIYDKVNHYLDQLVEINKNMKICDY